MQTSDLTFEIRDASFARIGQLLPTDGLATFKATLKFNNVGSWEISIPEVSKAADLLRTPGAGLICTNNVTGQVLFSGPTVAAVNEKQAGVPFGVWAIRGATDGIILGEHLCYPTPSTADVTLQTSAYDVATGVASTVMYGYVQRNIGSSAPAARKITGLSLAADAGLGSTVTGSARFDNLGEYLTTLATVSTPQLGFDVKQSGSGIQFSVYQPSDKTATVRMDTANGTLQKTTYGYGYGSTRAIVAGQGVGTARTFQEVTTSASTAAESTWSRRVEKFVDQRNTNDATQLSQAGLDELASGGTITSLSVVPSSDTTMAVFKDWGLGDKVSVVVGSQQVSATVSAITLAIGTDGLRVGATVGDPNGFDFESVLMKRQTDAASRLTTLETREAPTGTAGTLTVPGGGTGATSFTSGAYLKGAGTSAVTAQAGIPASDITSGVLPISRGGNGNTLGPGLIPIVPTSVFVASGSSSASASGQVAITDAAYVVLNGIFSAAYDNYLVKISLMHSTGDYIYARFASGGTTNLTATYYQSGLGISGAGAISGSSQSLATYAQFGYAPATYKTANYRFDIYNPYKTDQTTVDSQGGYSNVTYLNRLLFNATNSFDGLTLGVVNGGGLTGTVSVYAYKQ